MTRTDGKALDQAHQAYGVRDAKVVFVVNEDLRNFADWCQVGKSGGIIGKMIYIYI